MVRRAKCAEIAVVGVECGEDPARKVADETVPQAITYWYFVDSGGGSAFQAEMWPMMDKSAIQSTCCFSTLP